MLRAVGDGIDLEKFWSDLGLLSLHNQHHHRINVITVARSHRLKKSSRRPSPRSRLPLSSFANDTPFVVVATFAFVVALVADQERHDRFLVCAHPRRRRYSPLALLTPCAAGMAHNNDSIWAVPLQLTNFNITVALLGGFISLFGLVSFLLKENFYLSEARESAPPLLPRPALEPGLFRVSTWPVSLSRAKALGGLEGVRLAREERA